MKKIYLMLAVACLAAIGCTKEISDNTTVPTGSVVLRAKVETDTKVGATVDKENKKVAFTWTTGDAIAVQTAEGFADFNLEGEGGEANAIFTGNVNPVEGGVAIFPAAAAGSEPGKVNLPAEYDYAEGQTNALLYATVENNVMSFTHLGGLLSVEINDVPAGAKFVLTAVGQKINGEYTIDATGEVPVLNVTETESAEESTVTINFKDAQENAIVYVPLPAGDYTSLNAQVFNANGKIISEAIGSSTKSISRKMLKAMPNMVLLLNDWFVTPSGAGTKDGSSWNNAMGVAELRTLLAQPVDGEGNQDDAAAHAKADLLDGATINMAVGDYYLAGEGNKEVKVEFTNYNKQVSIRFEGGYPNNLKGTSKAKRDTTSLISAFTGNKEASVFMFGNQTDITFDGITFKDGNQNNSNGGAVRGAAGGSGDCTLTFNSCRFINNKNGNGNTGASLFFNKCVSVVNNCYFAGNYARNGSALNMANDAGTCTVTNCIFENNSTGNTSGAVQNGGKTATFTDCVFKKNKAGSWGGGGFHTGGNANTTFTGCDFIENTAPQAGAVSIEAATCTFTDCTFHKNSATKSNWDENADKSSGGAINMRNNDAVCVLNNCTFTENTATAGNGGAIASPNGGAKLTINAGTSFVNNTSQLVGGAIYMKCNMSITGTSENKVSFIGCNTLSITQAAANGGAIWRGGDKALTIKHAIFSNCEAGKESGSTVNYSNGGAIYTSTTGAMTIENCEFTGGRARNGGAISMNGNATYKFKDCKFHNIICLSGANHDGTAGNFNGAVGQIGAGTAEFERCIFENNVVKGCSSVLHMNGESVVAKFTDCELTNNKAGNSSPSATCIRMESEKQILYMNRCLVKGNQGETRGMIQLNKASSLAYFNDVTFVDNYNNLGGSSWGVVIHGSSGNVCMNNITSYNNYSKKAAAGNNIVSFNSDGGWLVINSTIIDATPLSLIRGNGSRTISVCNNILINTFTPNNIYTVGTNTKLIDKGHNLMSCSANPTNGAATNLLSQSTSTLAGSYSEKWTGTHPYAVYLWSKALTGFTPATGNEVYEAIAAYTEKDTNVVASGTIGEDFYKWLKSIGAVTESGDQKIFKDARGVTRTGNMWPGAYQQAN